MEQTERQREIELGIVAGIAAARRWAIGENVRIVFVTTSKCAIPTCGAPLGWRTEQQEIPERVWRNLAPDFGQEEVALETYALPDGRQIRMGYGPRTNVLAVNASA